tara:strand:- start:656 stop:1561 length:906 start_codon:yes stop_codon:yes gene_type:complete
MYLFNKADGYQTEGIGAVAQCQIHTYTLSRMLGVEFASTKFENLQHYQEHSTQVEFCQDVTKFFNFPKGQLNSDNVVSFEKIDEEFIKFVEENRNEKDLYVEVGRADMMRTADNNYQKWNSFVKDLSSLVVFDKSKYYFDEEKLNVSLHITNFIEGRDNDRSTSREQFIQGNDKEKYYINLLQKFDKILNDKNNRASSVEKEYHIYSRSQTPGDLEQFDAFTKLGLPIEFHIDEHPLTSLYHLIHSDIKVLSNSSFSYISAIYGDGLSIARDNFHHKIPENVIYSDYDGNFDESSIYFVED